MVLQTRCEWARECSLWCISCGRLGAELMLWKFSQHSWFYQSYLPCYWELLRTKEQKTLVDRTEKSISIYLFRVIKLLMSCFVSMTIFSTLFNISSYFLMKLLISFIESLLSENFLLCQKRSYLLYVSNTWYSSSH